MGETITDEGTVTYEAVVKDLREQTRATESIIPGQRRPTHDMPVAPTVDLYPSESSMGDRSSYSPHVLEVLSRLAIPSQREESPPIELG